MVQRFEDAVTFYTQGWLAGWLRVINPVVTFYINWQVVLAC
jgi:hypothetical protein